MTCHAKGLPGDGLAKMRSGWSQYGWGAETGERHGRALLGEVDGFGVLAEAEDPKGDDGDKREDGPAAARKERLALADL